MRSLILLLAIVCLSACSGCTTTQPAKRAEEMMIDSEFTGQIDASEWRRSGWMTESEHLTPYRTHGGVGPASSSI